MRLARLTLEGAERLREALLRVGRFDGEQAIEELGHLGRARAGDDLLTEDRERVEGVADRGTGARARHRRVAAGAAGFAAAGAA